MCCGNQLLARLIAIRVWVQVPMLCGFCDLYGFLFRHALCMLLWNAYWGLSGSFPLAVTCILLSVLLPAALVIDNLNTSIPDSLLTSIVFSFQKCLAAIPFTWGKKASWLTQTEQKLSFLLCITYYERNGGAWGLKPGEIWVSLVRSCCWKDTVVFLSLPSLQFLLSWSFVVSSSDTGWLR